MDKKLFIRTTSKESADKLIKLGYVLVKSLDGEWTFINDSRKTFEGLDNTVYTNKIEFG